MIVGYSKKIILPFFLLILYWLYVGFVTQPIIVHDAETYEALGRLLSEHGWVSYFTTGPNREPVYPALIAWAMQIDSSGYQNLLKFFQFSLLTITMGLLAVLMRRAQIKSVFVAGVLLYFGFSPAIVNSALSVFSEIVTYVFIVAIVYAVSLAWDKLPQYGRTFAAMMGVVLGLLFVGITLSKAIYEIIFYFFMAPLIWLAVKNYKKKKAFYNILMCLLVMIGLFQSAMIGYKFLNKKYNGIYTLTDRGAWALYGNTARRQGPMNAQRVMAGVAYQLFEHDGCQALMKSPECDYWDLPTSDKLAADKNYEVVRNFPPAQRDPQLLHYTKEKIFANPLQYALLTGLDWVHMFFWENTQIGFVAYPDTLDQIFHQPLIKRGWRFLLGGLSIMAVIMSLIAVGQHKISSEPQATIVFFALYLILLHNSFYALFSTLPRYALPMAPLYLFLIVFSLQRCFSKS